MSEGREGHTTPRAVRGVLWVVALCTAVLLAAAAVAQTFVWVMG